MQDPSFGVGSDILSSRKIGSPLAENVELGAQCFATMQTPSESFLISCGNWENSFQVISLNDGRMVQSIRHHKDVVSCIAGNFHNWKTVEIFLNQTFFDWFGFQVVYINYNGYSI